MDEDVCIGCKKCYESCPFEAIDMVSVPREMEGQLVNMLKARMNEVLCKGCGTCTGGCPTHKIDQMNLRTNQISGMIKVLFPVFEAPKIEGRRDDG